MVAKNFGYLQFLFELVFWLKNSLEI